MDIGLVKLAIVTVIAVILAALMAMIMWPFAVPFIWGGLVLAALSILWWQHRTYPADSIIDGWRDGFRFLCGR